MASTKIKSITAHPLQYPEPHDHGKLRCITLARVEAVSGEVGWGECISQFPESARATSTIIEEGLAPLLIGETAVETERLHAKMLGHVWWYGPQGIAAFAISAIDMALWDLKGKLLDQPVCNLLGSMQRRQVPAMASIHLDMEDLDWSINEFSSFVEAGYQWVKGGWGKNTSAVFGLDRERDMLLLQRIREAIGDEPHLVLDVLGARVKWNVKEAIARIRELEPYRLAWIEEPLPPRDLEAHRQLREAVATRIGTGEQEWDLEGYRRLIRSGGVDVVQIDPGRCLGLTNSLVVIKLVEAEHLAFSAHTWSSALNTAASVHLLAMSRAGLSMDFKPHESPMQHELVEEPWEQVNGFLTVPSQPGLGVTIRESVVEHYEIGPTRAHRVAMIASPALTSSAAKHDARKLASIAARAGSKDAINPSLLKSSEVRSVTP